MPARHGSRLALVLALALRAAGAAAAEDDAGVPACDPEQVGPSDPRVLMMCTHHVNYVMLSRADVPDSHALDYGYVPDPHELKIQVSVKLPVFQGAVDYLAGDDASLWFGFTQTAWWQITQDSAPFRETNYEPEVFFENGLPEGWGDPAHRWRLGIGHQSNGQAGALSRSWNRIRGELDLHHGALTVRARLWWRWPEADVDDDNPDIEEYLGYGDLAARWTVGGRVLAAKLVNAIGPGHKRGIQFEWMFHMGRDGEPAWMLQLYHGYGESLIDYDEQITRVGIALAVGDPL